MNNFLREQRYVVIKLSDIEAAKLNAKETSAFKAICEKVSLSRIKRSKGLLECVIVESDWPEFSPTWFAIEQRVKRENCKHIMQWHQIAGEGKICSLCGTRDELCDD